jgi:hypothetical protein
MREAEVEQAPGAGDVGADGGIHEAREQRHAADAQDGRLRIDPGADRGLEDLHRRADDVEDQDDLGLLPGLQLESEHGDLDDDRGDDEEVVAGEPGALRIEQVRPDQQRQHQRAEQTGPALLDAEADEFVKGVR